MKKQKTSTITIETKKLEQEVKANKKFNVKAWLIASTFSILSCALGLTNLIIHLVDKN